MTDMRRRDRERLVEVVDVVATVTIIVGLMLGIVFTPQIAHFLTHS